MEPRMHSSPGCGNTDGIFLLLISLPLGDNTTYLFNWD